MNNEVYKTIKQDADLMGFHRAMEDSVLMTEEALSPTFLKLRDRYLKAYERISKYIQKHSKD